MSRSLLGAMMLSLAGLSTGEIPPVAERCVGCHTETGVTDDPDIPTLAGASDFYLDNQFAVFSAQARPCIVEALDDDIDKCAVIGSLSDEQKTELIDFFSAQAYAPFRQSFDPEAAARGEAIHAERCERCHSDSGWEPRDDAGILAGQPIAYLVRQLENFTAGRRWQPTSMEPQTEDLAPEDIRALAHFYARSGLERAADSSRSVPTR